MKIVVTGHRGTVGRPLMIKLKARGHEVYGIDLQHSPDGIRADVGNYRQLAEAFAKIGPVDMVYHLAAEFGRYNGEDFNEQLWMSNAVGTKNILRLQKELGFDLTFASSSEAYGERHTTEPLHEGLPLNPMFCSNDYAISKMVNEAQIANAAKQWGNRVMTLRFFNAYGPGEYYHDYRSVVCLFCYRALKGLPYTVYEGYHRVFQYIDDLVATLGNAATFFHPGETINVGGDEYCSVEDLHKEICKHVPDAAERVIYVPEEKHNVVSKRPDITLARTLLGHNPRIRLEHGIPRTLNWLKRTYS
jgi:dTDP-glucose 4,6-dehydratase